MKFELIRTKAKPQHKKKKKQKAKHVTVVCLKFNSFSDFGFLNSICTKNYKKAEIFQIRPSLSYAQVP
jgi:hypothetical protein